VFKGRVTSDSFYPIIPGSENQVIIESTKAMLGRTKGCLLYEILKHNNHQVPLIWGSRIFLAIGVSINSHQVDERKVAIKLISVKSRWFKGAKEEVENLYGNVLHHFMHTHGQNSQWNLEKLGLHLEVDFDREVQAKLCVRLSRVNILPDNMPIFHNYGDFM
jgi:hypothetical protein